MTNDFEIDLLRCRMWLETNVCCQNKPPKTVLILIKTRLRETVSSRINLRSLNQYQEKIKRCTVEMSDLPIQKKILHAGTANVTEFLPDTKVFFYLHTHGNLFHT